MKFRFYISITTIISFGIVVLIVILYLFFDIRPFLEVVHFVEKINILFVVLILLLIPLALFFADLIRYKKHLKEKSELFNNTIHSIQDTLNNFLERMQLLIMDLNENNYDETICKDAENIFNETKEILNLISSIDPIKIHKFEFINKIKNLKLENDK